MREIKMKTIIKYVFLFSFLFVAGFFAQKRESMNVAKEAQTQGQNFNQNENKNYPVDAREFLQKFYKANNFDLAKAAETALPSLKKATAWNFSVGDKHYWYAANFVTNNYDYLPTTCRAVGSHCYIFVVDSLWTLGYVTQAAVDSVRINFDSRTPANPNKGIYETETEVFGTPPDNFDNDPKIIIVILDIKDGWTPQSQGGYVAGFFDYTNQYSTQTNNHSNEAEMYYLDANPLNLKVEAGIRTGMSTTAHEFQHMIHYNYFRSGDETFFDEGFSEAAVVICGFPFYSAGSYQDESNIYLLNWRHGQDEVLNDYSRAARFTLYLKEQFGTQVFTKYMQNKIKSISGLNSALSQIGTARRFNDILVDFFVANYLNNKSIDSRWGYDYPGIPKMRSTVYGNPNVSQTNSSIYKLASVYLTFPQGSNLSVNINNNGQNAIKAKVIKIGSNTAAVEDVTMNSNFSVSGFGTTYNEATVFVYHNDENASDPGPFSFSYSASGTANNAPIEIAYDTTEPEGVFVLSVGDTMAVRFDGRSGTKLDSIRVALRNTASIEGGVWKAGTTTFLGQNLASISVAGKTTPSYNYETQSYPVPYPNWVAVNLGAQNIDASNDFVVGFVVNGVYENSSSPYNRVMITSIPGSSPYHSYTYLHNPSSGSPGWYYIGDGSKISLYLIRAYVSYPTSAYNEPIELLPADYSLEQNYPNPFNPTTQIKFNLPKQSEVLLKIYDMLGREVASLVNGEMNAGTHLLTWDGKDNSGNLVASGVYFYRMTAGEFVDTKKMVLVR